ncbi:MAG: YfgM family protein [Parahaliea sp.]
MSSYQSEDEQVEALRQWWDENGRSTLIGIGLALALAFGWQGWKNYSVAMRDGASNIYQRLLQAAATAPESAEEQGEAERLALELKTNYAGTSYAQFSALQLARLAVESGEPEKAESELRWVLSKADSGSDMARIAQQRLARVLAWAGKVDEALALLEAKSGNPYQASYALARGDILMTSGRNDEARSAYTLARQLESENPGQVNLALLEQKLASLGESLDADIVATDDAADEGQ